jgi:hypothetical protein
MKTMSVTFFYYKAAIYCTALAAVFSIRNLCQQVFWSNLTLAIYPANTLLNKIALISPVE